MTGIKIKWYFSDKEGNKKEIESDKKCALVVRTNMAFELVMLVVVVLVLLVLVMLVVLVVVAVVGVPVVAVVAVVVVLVGNSALMSVR